MGVQLQYLTLRRKLWCLNWKALRLYPENLRRCRSILRWIRQSTYPGLGLRFQFAERFPTIPVILPGHMEQMCIHWSPEILNRCFRRILPIILTVPDLLCRVAAGVDVTEEAVPVGGIGGTINNQQSGGIIMPGGNGTGPAGAGQMTGRGAGFCAGYGVPGFSNSGFGCGRGFRRGGFAMGWNAPAMGSQWGAPEAEQTRLKSQAELLKNQLDAIQQRLNALEDAKQKIHWWWMTPPMFSGNQLSNEIIILRLPEILLSAIQKLDNFKEQQNLNTYPECIPCLLKQSFSALQMCNAGENETFDILKQILRRAADFDPRHSPPEMATYIHRIIRTSLGCADPYKDIKHKAIQEVLKYENDIRARIIKSSNPLYTAIRFALVGNVLDFAIFDWNPSVLAEQLENAMHKDCLLYTSDAADEEDSVDLGGRRRLHTKPKKHRL
eukprot:TRINITY_DN3779_c0_g1_i6.p1 TRINITY_DN3779_c0_g1~~TRINITY_DN3779_c0_g1_i6.p1  ORF type:complete len:439 (-),score=17.02 TRINITY_DN3779_c0_g1_i6:21-1337(-)